MLRLRSRPEAGRQRRTGCRYPPHLFRTPLALDARLASGFNPREARVRRAELLAILRRHRVAVQATVSPIGAPQAALVGVAVGEDFEIVFDTLQSSRKACNLRE